ncbi:MAG: hypothetical protein WCE63_10820 [Acidobacteriaceae bacterium]
MSCLENPEYEYQFSRAQTKGFGCIAITQDLPCFKMFNEKGDEFELNVDGGFRLFPKAGLCSLGTVYPKSATELVEKLAYFMGYDLVKRAG